MRIGVFGGTFDPVHLGHLIIAEQCREQARLDQVRFIPAARPPHKQERELTPFAQRAEMLSLAIAGQPAFAIDELEKDRPGPSYTADTLEQIKSRQPDAEVSLVLGADSLHDLPQWYQPMRVAELAEILVVPRLDWTTLSADELRKKLHLAAGVALRLQVIQMPTIGISSSDLRKRTAEGRSLRYQVPRAVEAYIHDKALYRQ